MPAQKKKKDSVTRNMEARYAPVEGSLRSKPIQSRIDVSGSTSAPPPFFHLFQSNGQTSAQNPFSFQNLILDLRPRIL
ncbi:Ovule protein [Caenorhabditis elegans]|uniref:Ovule protein n=1 Tax=Caenorhabditis elegans TaxID=6239 RepID=A0A3B1E9Z9_CAEEL|nr:Ovule protein [Caenorhabditis elegans]VAY52629.2 Ovule protein [Caenorhabditis elegans]